MNPHDPYSPSPSSSPLVGTPSSQASASPIHNQQQYQQQQQQQQSRTPDPQTIRQRQVVHHATEEEEQDQTQMKRFVKTLKTLDVYPKTEEDIAIKTQSGGAVSLISMAIIIFLMFNEFWSFLSSTTTHSIQVDTRPAAKLQINFDLVFHALRCSETSIDVMDVSGEAQVAVEGNTHRMRLTAEGIPIGKLEYEDHAHENPDGSPKQQQMINPMLMAMGFGGQPNLLPDTHVDKKGEGCRLSGNILVNKVAGNLHIALGGVHSHGHHTEEAGKPTEQGHTHGNAGQSHSHDGHHSGHPQQQHLHQFMVHEIAAYNCSHTINQFSFGELFPGVVNPLDGTSQIIPAGAGSAHMQYFLKVVPTIYESTFTRTNTNQFSVTQQTRFISESDAYSGRVGQQIPGIFFVYDLSPFMVKVSDKRIPLSTFLTSLFAIVGGVFTVAGVIDSLLYHSSKFTNRITSPHAKK